MINVEITLDFTGLDLNKIMQVVGEEVYKGAIEVQNIARVLVPVRTGSLRRSIQAYTLEQIRETLKVDVRANMPYAAYVEYGTRKMTARPYMRPAAEEGFAKMVESIRQRLAGGS